MAFIIRNISGAQITINALGKRIEAGTDVDLEADFSPDDLQVARSDIETLINAGQAAILDPSGSPYGSVGSLLALDSQVSSIEFSHIFQLTNTVVLNINVTPFALVTWQTQNYDSSDFTFSGSSVTAQRNGVYEAAFKVCGANQSTGRVNVAAALRLNGSEITNSRAYAYARNTTDAFLSCVCPGIILNVTAGDVLDVATRQFGSAGTVNTESGLSFVRLRRL